MPTISEIEAERARILAEIENRAKQGTQSTAENPRLKDWLKAAEEIMPESQEPRPQSSQMQGGAFTQHSIPNSDADFRQQTESSARTATGGQTAKQRLQNLQETSGRRDRSGISPTNLVIASGLSMVGLFAIALYFSHQSLMNEMTQLRQDSLYQLQSMKEEFTAAQTQTNLPNEAQRQIEQLQTQVTALQQQLKALSSQPQQTIELTGISELPEEEQTALLAKINAGITEEKLAEKLAENNVQLANQIEQRLEKRLAPILKGLDMADKAALKTAVRIDSGAADDDGTVQNQQDLSLLTIAQPTAPSEPLLISDQPISSKPQPEKVSPLTPESLKTTISGSSIQPVSSIESTVTLSEPSKPIKAIEAIEPIQQAKLTEVKISGINPQDMAWISEQPRKNFTLQLSSTQNAADLQKMLKNQNIPNAKILPQLRNNKVNYILVTDSVATQSEATALAEKVKQELNITPWIRTVGHVQKYLID